MIRQAILAAIRILFFCIGLPLFFLGVTLLTIGMGADEMRGVVRRAAGDAK